jgi:hypothetical protein
MTKNFLYFLVALGTMAPLAASADWLCTARCQYYKPHTPLVGPGIVDLRSYPERHRSQIASSGNTLAEAFAHLVNSCSKLGDSSKIIHPSSSSLHVTPQSICTELVSTCHE